MIKDGAIEDREEKPGMHGFLLDLETIGGRDPLGGDVFIGQFL
jgi:hypothetical protein